MTIYPHLAQLAEPWSALYGATPGLQTATTFAHFAGFLLGGGFAIAADGATIRVSRRHLAQRRRQLAYIRGIHQVVLAGLAVTLVSGALMFLADVEALAASKVFWTKIALVLLLVANGAVMARTESAVRSGAVESDAGWSRMRSTAVRSLALWFAAVLAGTLLVNAPVA